MSLRIPEKRTRLFAAMVLLFATSCVMEGQGQVTEPLDSAYFHCEVEPVLVASCAFYACHGNASRAFQVFGPNRLRLEVSELERATALTEQERAFNLRSALGFAGSAAGYDEPLLVAKPLSSDLGGAFHGGVELNRYGSVYQSDDDPELGIIRSWLRGETEEPTCFQ